MSSSHPFIRASLAELKKGIDRELFSWVSGKRYPGLSYTGTPVIVFWGNFREELVTQIVNGAFEAADRIVKEHDLDPIDATNAASDVAQDSVHAVIGKMIDCDQKMRGKGFPQSVAPKNAEFELKKSLKMVETRRLAQIALATDRKRQRSEIERQKSSSAAHILPIRLPGVRSLSHFTTHVSLMRPLLDAEAPKQLPAANSTPGERMAMREARSAGWIDCQERPDENGHPMDFFNITIKAAGRILIAEYDMPDPEPIVAEHNLAAFWKRGTKSERFGLVSTLFAIWMFGFLCAQSKILIRIVEIFRDIKP